MKLKNFSMVIIAGTKEEPLAFIAKKADESMLFLEEKRSLTGEQSFLGFVLDPTKPISEPNLSNAIEAANSYLSLVSIYKLPAELLVVKSSKRGLKSCGWLKGARFYERLYKVIKTLKNKA